jgi:hypothetical protein
MSEPEFEQMMVDQSERNKVLQITYLYLQSGALLLLFLVHIQLPTAISFALGIQVEIFLLFAKDCIGEPDLKRNVLNKDSIKLLEN